MRIGILIAMDKEFQQVVSLLSDITDDFVSDRRFVKGRIGDNEVVVHQCGIGKVNAACGTTAMIDAFAPDCIISTGVAGGASVKLNVQEVVVSTATCYHDVYCGSDVAYGQIPGLPERFTADSRLVDVAATMPSDVKVTPGLIVTGDWFVDSREKMQQIAGRFPDAMAVDMESAAIAHACYQRKVPFVSFRVISDIPLADHKAAQYFDFWDRLADNSFHTTKTFLERI